MNKLKMDTALNQYVLAWLLYKRGLDEPVYIHLLDEVSEEFDIDNKAWLIFIKRLGTDARLKYHSRAGT